MEWEQQVWQALSTLLARMDVSAGATAATETADTAAASLSVFQSVDKRVAEAMRKKWPHGIPPEGLGWKQADRILEPYGGVRSKPTYYRAIDINRALLAAGQSQG
jgi:hypothetical protein